MGLYRGCLPAVAPVGVCRQRHGRSGRALDNPGANKRRRAMAIYSLHVGNVSRAAGSSSCAVLSYITSEQVRDERLGVTYHGFGRRERVVESHTLLPEGAPERFKDAAVLFNELELHERAVNARTAKKIMVALPREFTPEQRRETVEAFISSQLTDRGYAATYAIHEDKAGKNPHAHILVANRQLDGQGQWVKAKSRKQYRLDEQGQRMPLIDPATGLQKLDKRHRKQWRRVSVATNPLDEKQALQDMRVAWAAACNRRLASAAHITHESYQARGVQRIPTTHEGYAARGIEARGGVSPRCEDNRLTVATNLMLERLEERITRLAHAIRQLVATLRAHLQPSQDHDRQEPAETRQESAVKQQGGHHERHADGGRRGDGIDAGADRPDRQSPGRTITGGESRPSEQAVGAYGATARGDQELPGQSTADAIQPESRPEHATRRDPPHIGASEPSLDQQLETARHQFEAAKASLRASHSTWLQGVSGQRGANGQQERAAAQTAAERAAERERAALEAAARTERQARLARPEHHQTPRPSPGLTR